MSHYHRKPDDTKWAQVRIYRKYYKLLREIAEKENLTLNDTVYRTVEAYQQLHP